MELGDKDEWKRNGGREGRKRTAQKSAQPPFCLNVVAAVRGVACGYCLPVLLAGVACWWRLLVALALRP